MKQVRILKPVAWLSMLRVVGCIGGVVALAVCLSACQGGDAGKQESLTIALVPTEINALLYVAEAQNFFASNGLQVTLKEDYESGAAAAAAALNGEAEVAVAAEFPIVRQVFDHKNITSFGTIARYENTYIIWHTNNGIQTMNDLKGKNIGVTLQTISEFYLGRTLDLNGVNIRDVNLVDVKAAEAEKALLDGVVDAVVTWEPWVNQIKQSMGMEVTASALQSSQFAYWNLVSASSWSRTHPDTIERLLRSLAQAEDFIASHQDEAKAIVRKRMDFEEAYLELIWGRYQFLLTLDQSFITAMEDEARWMIENNLTAEMKAPDFLDYVYVDGLQAVKPNAVNIIR